jgi:hypothetical protein
LHGLSIARTLIHPDRVSLATDEFDEDDLDLPLELGGEFCKRKKTTRVPWSTESGARRRFEEKMVLKSD